MMSGSKPYGPSGDAETPNPVLGARAPRPPWQTPSSDTHEGSHQSPGLVPGDISLPTGEGAVGCARGGHAPQTLVHC